LAQQSQMPAQFETFIHVVADIFDAHTAAIFVKTLSKDVLKLLAYHSLSDDIKKDCILNTEQSLIGFVAKHGRPLHMARFDRSALTIGIYNQEVDIKSLYACPIPNDNGVLFIDSKTYYEFSPKKQKIALGCAELANYLITTNKNIKRLEIVDKWYNHIKNITPPIDVKIILDSICNSLSLSQGLVAVSTDNEKYQVLAVTGVKEEKWLFRPIPIENGLVGWMFRNKRDLFLFRSSGERERSFFIKLREPFKLGPLVYGFFLSFTEKSYVWIFTGNMDASVLPENPSKIFEPYLRLILKDN